MWTFVLLRSQKGIFTHKNQAFNTIGMNRKVLLLLIVSFTSIYSTRAQGVLHENDPGGETTIGNPHDKRHSPINAFLKQGHVSGHVRNFTMATINQGELTDYFANATGGAIHYETDRFLGHFSIGVKGIFTFNTYSSDLLAPDPLTGKGAKWELELFDINHPDKKHDLDRLEELYIKFHYGEKSFLEVGKFDLDETPLLNRRDGRMKAFVFEGIWNKWVASPSSTLQSGLITKVSPRSTTEFFTIREALGSQNMGYQPDGTRADYHEAAHARAIGMLGYEFRTESGLKLQAWDMYLDRVTNIAWLQADYNGGLGFAGIQAVAQRPLAHQADLDYSARYMQPDERGRVVATRVGLHSQNWEISANYLRSFSQGRFLFPREFGRERLYTSMPRSWMEGLGDTHVVTLVGLFQKPIFQEDRVSIDLRWSHIQTPAPTDYRLNKYGVQPYHQTNAAIKYACNGRLEGLEFQVLYLYRGDYPAGDHSPSMIFNKYNMHQINVITNLIF